MKKRWVVSDTHFGHRNVVNFLREDGSKMRPWNDIDKMDEDMIILWNNVVKPGDRVYHLGDVVINRRCLPILNRLNGEKVLIKGNHDIFKLREYLPYFEDIRSYVVSQKIIMSHIPIHPDSKGRFIANVHGHLHHRKLEDPWYFNACVEHTNYQPILFDKILEKVLAKDGEM